MQQQSQQLCPPQSVIILFYYRSQHFAVLTSNLTQVSILIFLASQHPSQASTLIGHIGPRAHLAVEEELRRGHENVPSQRTPRAEWTARLWGPR